MVYEELDILDIVAKDPFISQRRIAHLAGISLGQVNFLMKKFVSVGLIKIEGQTAKSIQYHLTPKGMAALTEKTLKYVKRSYVAVREMSEKVAGHARDYKSKGYDIHVVGSHDEMIEICRLALSDSRIPHKIGYPEKAEKAVIICWEEEVELKTDYTCINLLKDKYL